MKRIILNHKKADYALIRLCHQLVENHKDFSNSAIIALQPRGTLLGRALVDKLNEHFNINPLYGELDVTFYRDDFRRTENPLGAQCHEYGFQR